MERERLIVEKKKLIKVGGSICVALPPEFLKLHGLEKGDEIAVIANHIVKLVPLKEK